MKIKDLKDMIKEAKSDKSVLLARPDLLMEANVGRVKRRIEEEGIPFAMPFAKVAISGTTLKNSCPPPSDNLNPVKISSKINNELFS